MEAILKAKQIGGSICIIIPKKVVEHERIHVDDNIKVNIERSDDLTFLWGKFKHLKKPTDKIMKEINDGEMF